MEDVFAASSAEAVGDAFLWVLCCDFLFSTGILFSVVDDLSRLLASRVDALHLRFLRAAAAGGPLSCPGRDGICHTLSSCRGLHIFTVFFIQSSQHYCPVSIALLPLFWSQHNQISLKASGPRHVL